MRRRRLTRFVTDGGNARGAELVVPALTGYARAASPPFGFGHMGLLVPICHAGDEPILRHALLDGPNFLDRAVNR